MEIIVLLKPEILTEENNRFEEIQKTIVSKLGTIEYIKLKRLDKELLKLLYAEHSQKDYFEENIVKNMTAGPVVVLIISVHQKIKDFFEINQIKKEIREIYGITKSQNAIHISDSLKSVAIERELLGI